MIVAGAQISTPYGKGVVKYIRLDRTITLQLKWSILYFQILDGSQVLTKSIYELEQELIKRRPIVSKIRQHVQNLGHIPDIYREEIWRLLLNVSLHTSKIDEMKVIHLDETNQRVIKADVLRTRGQDTLFQQENTRNELELLLTYFCKRKGCRYRQGINEVLAPFFWIVQSNNKFLKFDLFYAFIDKFLPNMFLQDSFQTLQCIQTLFNTLLHHFDAHLYEHFSDNDLSPVLYSTPWFLTFFASKLNNKNVTILWDHAITLSQYSESFVLYVGLSILILNRDVLLTSTSYDLPHVVTNKLEMNNIHAIIQTAKDFMANTSQYFHKLIAITTRTPEIDLKETICNVLNVTTTASKDNKNHETTNESKLLSESEEFVVDLLQSSLNTVIMPIFTSDVINYFSQNGDSKVKFYFLDIRTFRSYHQIGHFPNSYHIDPIVLKSSEITLEWMRRELEIFKSMTNCCLCVIGAISDHTIQDAQKLMSLLSLWRFNRLGMLIDFDRLFQKDDAKYVQFVQDYILISDEAEESNAFETMQQSINDFQKQMEPIDVVVVRPKTTSTASEMKKEEKEGEKDILPTAPEVTRTSVLLNKGAAGVATLQGTGVAALSSLSSWWNSSNVSNVTETAEYADTADTTLTWHRGDLITKVIVVSNGGIGVQRIAGTELVKQYVLVTSTHVIFLKDSDKIYVDDDTGQRYSKNDECVVLSKYPIACLLKVASRQRETLLLLIMSFSHTSTIDVNVNDVTTEKKEKPKKIGFVLATEEVRQKIVETIKKHYSVLKQGKSYLR